MLVYLIEVWGNLDHTYLNVIFMYVGKKEEEVGGREDTLPH